MTSELPAIDSARLRLEPLRPDEVDALFAIARNPASIEDYQLAATVRADVEAWVAPLLTGEELGWTIRSGERIIGLVALEPAADDGEEDGGGGKGPSAEIGYFVDAAEAGQGFASEATAAVTRWALETGRFRRLTAGVTVRNVASRRVLEKAGYRHTHTSARDWEWKGELLDSAYYVIESPP
ncbi:MAG: GNAT family N-acetyltransferase [Actinomycetota bacterium]